MTNSLITNEEDFDDLISGYSDLGKVVENEHIDSGRWVEYYTVVWQETHENGERYFSYDYERPSTEMQEGSESEFDASGIKEVFPYEVVITKYATAEELAKKN